MTSPAPALTREQPRLQLLYEISREISTRLNPDELLPRLLQHATSITQAQTGSLIIFNVGERVLHSALMVEGRFWPNEKGIAAKLHSSLAGWVVRNRQAALVQNTLEDSRWVQRPDDVRTGAKSAICVPLMGRERVAGVLTVVKPAPNTFQPDDLSFLTTIAEQSGIAIENALLFAESERREKTTRALAATAQAINATQQLDEILRLLVMNAQESIGVEAALIALVENDQLVFRETTGHGAERYKGMTLAPGQGVVGWAAQNNQAVLVPDTAQDPRFYRAFDEQAGFTIRAMACAPIQLQDTVIGVIVALNPLGGAFSDETLELLGSLAALAGTAIVHARQMADLQAAEERFAGLFQDSLDPILLTNLDGIITEANKKALEFFGFDEMVGMKVTRVHRTGTGFLGSDRFRHLTGGREITYQTSITTKSGAEVPMEVHAKAIRRGGQEFIQWIQHDLSERIALEELRNDMVSMIVHDLRSPLGNIISSLDVLKNFLPKTDDSPLALWTIATRSAARLSRLVDSLLDMRRLEAGQVVLNRTQTNLNTLINEAAEQVQPAAEGKDTALRVEVPPRLPYVNIDGDMIRRVMINLMDNAVKYTPRGGSIFITAKASIQEVTISIRDNGPGIPPSEHTKVFNKFSRLERGRESAPKGLGLGLAFCRLAVEAHGGRIWVESALGRGSTFNFTLPI